MKEIKNHLEFNLIKLAVLAAIWQMLIEVQLDLLMEDSPVAPAGIRILIALLVLTILLTIKIFKIVSYIRRLLDNK